MSERNVEIIRGVFERWASGDFNTPEVFASDVEFARYGGEVVVTREARGIEALSAAVFELVREWNDMRLQAERVVRVDDRVLVLARLRGVGRRSGVPIDHLETALFTLRDGKIVRWETYWDADEGMRAAGLDL